MKKHVYKIRLSFAIFVFVLSVLAFLGLFYPLKIFDVQFFPLLQRVIVDFSVFSLCAVIGLLLLTLIFGRFYCSLLCPFGILQEIVSFLRGKKINKQAGNFGFKYLIAALVFGSLIGGSSLIVRYFEPYSVFGSLATLSLYGIIFTVVVIVFTLFKNRFFCINLCPVGAILGLISKLSVNKIYIEPEKCVSCGKCSSVCPSGCINLEDKTIDNETCIKCLKCLSGCPNGALNFGVKPQKFSFNRRRLVWGLGALAVLGAGYTLGLNLVKNTIGKFKNIILPPGAISADNMVNKCLNCNLCINMCPHGILVKADENFPAVHIDYTKGKQSCEYKCNNCSFVCPSGAIKKISLEEKQKTRIAIAKVDESCRYCGKCEKVCPKGAISYIKTDDSSLPKAFIDETKCIGCGKCQKVCFHKSIKIFAVDEQTVI